MVQKQDVSDFKRTINHVYSPHVCLLATCLWAILHLQSLIKSTFSLTLPIFYLSLNDKFRSMKKEGKLEFRLLSVLNISGKIFFPFFLLLSWIQWTQIPIEHNQFTMVFRNGFRNQRVLLEDKSGILHLFFNHEAVPMRRIIRPSLVTLQISSFIIQIAQKRLNVRDRQFTISPKIPLDPGPLFWPMIIKLS